MSVAYASTDGQSGETVALGGGRFLLRAINSDIQGRRSLYAPGEPQCWTFTN